MTFFWNGVPIPFLLIVAYKDVTVYSCAARLRIKNSLFYFGVPVYEHASD